jgi:hypothetical protein
MGLPWHPLLSETTICRQCRAERWDWYTKLVYASHGVRTWTFLTQRARLTREASPESSGERRMRCLHLLHASVASVSIQINFASDSSSLTWLVD